MMTPRTRVLTALNDCTPDVEPENILAVYRDD